MILIAPLRMARSIVMTLPGSRQILAFQSLEELDRWRQRRERERQTIAQDVALQLETSGVELTSLSPPIREIVTWISSRTSVPTPFALQGRSSSRRSFYRMWNEYFDVSAGVFLRSVRARQAGRYLSSGMAPKETAELCGYSSVDQMRRALRELPPKH